MLLYRGLDNQPEQIMAPIPVIRSTDDQLWGNIKRKAKHQNYTIEFVLHLIDQDESRANSGPNFGERPCIESSDGRSTNN
jgi:hypothetical protein